MQLRRDSSFEALSFRIIRTFVNFKVLTFDTLGAFCWLIKKRTSPKHGLWGTPQLYMFVSFLQMKQCVSLSQNFTQCQRILFLMGTETSFFPGHEYLIQRKVALIKQCAGQSKTCWTNGVLGELLLLL